MHTQMLSKEWSGAFEKTALKWSSLTQTGPFCTPVGVFLLQFHLRISVCVVSTLYADAWQKVTGQRYHKNTQKSYFRVIWKMSKEENPVSSFHKLLNIRSFHVLLYKCCLRRQPQWLKRRPKKLLPHFWVYTLQLRLTTRSSALHWPIEAE